MMYHGCCITKGESTVPVFMWHHTWMTSSDPALHCSSSWCHLSSQLVPNNSVCIARWWDITISSRGCGNIAAVSLWPAVGFSSYHHMTIRSVLRTKTVFIPMLLRRRRSNDLHAGFFCESSELTTTGHAVMPAHKESCSLFSEKQLLIWSSHPNSSLVVS